MNDVLFKTTGVTKTLAPMNGSHYTLTELQSFVDGPVEFVHFGSQVLVVNEEGKLRGLMPNRLATDWVISHNYCELIVGNAAVIQRRHLK